MYLLSRRRGLWTVDCRLRKTRHPAPDFRHPASHISTLPIHQLFYLFRLDRNILHQVQVAIFLDHEIVFQADAYSFFRNINSRLYGEYHSWDNWLVHGAYIVYVQSQMMGGAVHKVLFVQGL